MSARAHEACISMPGTSLWRVEDRYYLVSTGAVTLAGGRTVHADSSGLAVSEFSDSVVRTEDAHCVNIVAADAVYASLATDRPPILISGCSQSYLWVVLEYSSAAESPTLLFESTGSGWSKVAEIDFNVTDKTARCAVVPDRPAPQGGITARAYCLLLG